MSLRLAWRFRGSHLRALMIAVGSMLLTSAARAETAVETVHLEYSASRTCPSADAFIAALRRDSAPFELVGADEARRLIDVDLHAETGRASGRFRFVDRAHSTTIDRQLTGPDCEAVGRALALMLALTMHRLSSAQTTVAADNAGSKMVEDAPPARPMPDAPKQTARPASTPLPTRPPARSVAVSLDAQVGVTRAVVAAVLPFGGLTLHLEPLRWPVRPSLAIGVRQSLPYDIGVAGGDASFLWTTGALRLCPHFFVAEPFAIAPCIEGAIGVLQADAAGLPSARTSTRFWREISGVVEARAHLSNHWFVTASALLVVPLSRSRFELSSGARISQAPVVGLGGSLGIGLSL